MVKHITLNRGMTALVDDDDFDRVAAFNWFANRADQTYDKWYAARQITVDGQRITVYLHRLILDAQPGVEVDHRNYDGLDCQRHNLRFATRAQQNQNRRKRPGTKNRFKGVNQVGRRWMAEIHIDRRRIYLGRFDTEVDAALAYDAKAIELFGEFAHPNFPHLQQVAADVYRGRGWPSLDEQARDDVAAVVKAMFEDDAFNSSKSALRDQIIASLTAQPLAAD